jgi:hypothetical protein
MRGEASADLLDVGHAAGGLEDGVHEQRLGEAGLASSWASRRST